MIPNSSPTVAPAPALTLALWQALEQALVEHNGLPGTHVPQWEVPGVYEACKRACERACRRACSRAHKRVWVLRA